MVPRRARRLSAEPVDRRAQMVEAAATVLAREGYESTSMKEIANQAGVSSGLLHYYFGTKEELLADVVSDLHDQLLREWQAAVAGVDDPLERVSRGIGQAAAKHRDRPEFWQLLFDMYAIGLKNPVIRERLNGMVTDLIGQFAAEVRRVDATLPTHSPLPAEDLATATLAAIDGVALVSSVTGRDGSGAYKALLALMLAYVGMSYLAAGQPVPFERMAELLGVEPPAVS